MIICDGCHRSVVAEKLGFDEWSNMICCTICRGIDPVNIAPRYYAYPDLVEDSGIYDPKAHGFSPVEGTCLWVSQPK